MNFYIEEKSLIQRLVDIEEDDETLGCALSTMEMVSEAEICTLFVLPDFYSFLVGDQTIGEILYCKQQDGNIRDILLRLQIALGRAETCEVFDPALGAGHASLLHAGLGALIVVGDFEFNEQWNSKKMMKVASPDQARLALRALYVAANLSKNVFSQYCEYMFDKLYFHVSPECVDGMGWRFEDIVERVIKHFSYLNDSAMTDFEKYCQPIDIIRRAGACGVEISPESPKTHKNAKAMAERDIIIGGEVLCCEWHTKLEPTRGRIHFYPWPAQSEKIRGKVGEKVIVGIIADHLM